MYIHCYVFKCAIITIVCFHLHKQCVISIFYISILRVAKV